MKVALLQIDLIWENAVENRKNIGSKIDSLDNDVDLIVLPEMFTTGFTMNAIKVAETMSGPTLNWLKSYAQNKNCAITGSLVIVEDNKFYNRLVFVYPAGTVLKYDKKHLFTLANEHKMYTAGNEKIIVEFKNFRICLQICYDLRFPVFSRNSENYDLLLYVASWPSVRIAAWNCLLQARAIENICYTIGVNRIGIDANGLHYTGQSQIIDCLGTLLIPPTANETTECIILKLEPQNEIRKKLNFLSDKDHYTLQK